MCPFSITREMQACPHLEQVFQNHAICFSCEAAREKGKKVDTDLFMKRFWFPSIYLAMKENTERQGSNSASIQEYLISSLPAVVKWRQRIQTHHWQIQDTLMEPEHPYTGFLSS